MVALHRPKAYIRYSKNALFVPFKDGIAVMYRMVPFTKNYLVNVEAKITLAMRVEEDGVIRNKFFNMPLEIAKSHHHDCQLDPGSYDQ